jgi:hypothetical protein
MLAPELKTKYGITGTYDNYYNEIEYLFSGVPGKDPSMEVEVCTYYEQIRYYNVTYVPLPGGKILAQVVVFSTEQGLKRYIEDEMCIFEDKGT